MPCPVLPLSEKRRFLISGLPERPRSGTVAPLHLGGHSWVGDQSPPGPPESTPRSGWGVMLDFSGSGRPSVLLPEVERAGVVLGLVIGLVIGLVLRLVVGLVVVLGHFRLDVADERGAHDGPHGFAPHHHGRASGHGGSSSGTRIGHRAMPRIRPGPVPQGWDPSRQCRDG